MSNRMYFIYGFSLFIVIIAVVTFATSSISGVLWMLLAIGLVLLMVLN